jgi:hypothetical protein
LFELADYSVEFHQKSTIEDRSATHVTLHVFYHLITIPCHLHHEIKEKVWNSLGIAHLPNGMRVLQPRPIYRTIQPIPDSIRLIFATPAMNWSFAATVVSRAQAEWGEGITGLLCHR